SKRSRACREPAGTSDGFSNQRLVAWRLRAIGQRQYIFETDPGVVASGHCSVQASPCRGIQPVEQVRHSYSSAIQDGFDRFHFAQRIACRLFLRLEHDPEATIRDVTTDKGFCRARLSILPRWQRRG